jgi:hypothetical protein
VFDFPEIQSELGLTAADVARLRDRHEKIQNDLAKQVIDGKMKREEAAKIYETTLKFGVNEGVRRELTETQRRKLADLLGTAFTFPK